MRESIRQLREICQEPRRPFDTWHGLHIARPISLYITIVFLKLGLSANTATFLLLASGLLSALIFVLGSRVAFLLGAILLQLWYILDHVDGEIARYHKEVSLTGVYFDRISHYIVHPLIFCVLGIGLFLRLGRVVPLVIGGCAAFSAILLDAVHDVSELVSLQKTKAAHNSGLVALRTHPSRRAFSLLHKLCTFPVIIDVLLVFTLLDFFFEKNTLIFFLWFYALSITFVWISKLCYFILTRKMDR